MKKNVVITALVVIIGCFAYLGIIKQKEINELRLELDLTQTALYATGMKLEEVQYGNEWSGDPHQYTEGLFKYNDFYKGDGRWKMRITNDGIDIPLWFVFGKRSAEIADSYQGFEWDKVLIEFK